MDRIINIWYYYHMDNDIFAIRDNYLTHGRGYVYSLQYHLVWCTKYRRSVLTDGIDEDCKTILLEIAEEYKFTILAMEVMPDHIHLLVDAKPQMSIMDMMRILKGTTARKLFMLHPDLGRTRKTAERSGETEGIPSERTGTPCRSRPATKWRSCNCIPR